MGGGCQGNTRDVVYAQAVPPSRKGGASGRMSGAAGIFLGVRIVFEVPSVMSARRTLPCGVASWGRGGKVG